jgi:hypothetical protein
MRSCPKCGASKDKHGKWKCRSFPHGAEFRQSVECKLNESCQRIDALTAERDEARRVARELLANLARGAWDINDEITKIDWMIDQEKERL